MVFEFSTKDYHLTLKMASAQVVETSVANNSPCQDSNHPDDHFQSRYVTPGFKPFSYGRRQLANAASKSKLILIQEKQSFQFVTF